MPRPPAETLHRTLARSIVAHLRREAVEPGTKLSESELARALGTSRSPIRGALSMLVEQGYAAWKASAGRRGRLLVLRKLPPPGTEDSPSDAGAGIAERLYWQIAADRLDGKLPELIGEADLARRYGAPRGDVHRALMQIMSEGWIERAPAGSWRFLSLIEGPGSYDESYRFRRAIEPAALLDPAFELTKPIAARLRREQQGLLDRADSKAPPDPKEIFELNSGFHLALMQASNNRFFADAGMRITRLRRLVGYVIALDRNRLVAQSREHLDILDRLESGDRIAAAELLIRHLDAGRASKARLLESARLTASALLPPSINPLDPAA